jgi:transposase
VNTVKQWVRCFEETGDVKRKVGSGRFKKTTPAQDATIFMQITAKPMTTLQEIKGN